MYKRQSLSFAVWPCLINFSTSSVSPLLAAIQIFMLLKSDIAIVSVWALLRMNLDRKATNIFKQLREMLYSSSPAQISLIEKLLIVKV